MRLFRALPERFRGRAKRTFARRETDVDRLRLGYKPQKFYPPTENIREAIGLSIDDSGCQCVSPFPRYDPRACVAGHVIPYCHAQT